MTMPIDLVLVRHGESEQNFANRASKRGDHSLVLQPGYRERHPSRHPLTAQGRRQAEAAGEWLRENFETFDRRYVSTYTRAMETAGLLQVPGTDWRADPLLREREWGELDGLSWEERHEKAEAAAMIQKTDPFYWIPPNGESLADVTVRLQKFFGTWNRQCSDQRVLVVCHGETMWALRFMIEQMTIERWMELEDSEEPGVKIFNCQILHYTRRDPMTGELSPHVDWMRSVNPYTPENSGAGWQRIERLRFSDDELLAMASKDAPLFADHPDNT